MKTLLERNFSITNLPAEVFLAPAECPSAPGCPNNPSCFSEPSSSSNPSSSSQSNVTADIGKDVLPALDELPVTWEPTRSPARTGGPTPAISTKPTGSPSGSVDPSGSPNSSIFWPILFIVADFISKAI